MNGDLFYRRRLRLRYVYSTAYYSLPSTWLDNLLNIVRFICVQKFNRPVVGFLRNYCSKVFQVMQQLTLKHLITLDQCPVSHRLFFIRILLNYVILCLFMGLVQRNWKVLNFENCSLTNNCRIYFIFKNKFYITFFLKHISKCKYILSHIQIYYSLLISNSIIYSNFHFICKDRLEFH